MSRFETQKTAERARDILNLAEPGQFFVYKSNYACDPWVVAKLPQVGEPVSEAFNGDYYPRGVIVKVSKTGAKVTTSTGHVFTRSRKRPSVWANGSFSMVPGHHDKRNPHF